MRVFLDAYPYVIIAMGCIAAVGFLMVGLLTAATLTVGTRWEVSDRVSQFWLAAALIGVADGGACLCLAFVKWLLGVC